MALSNQATITLAVNIQNMAGLKALQGSLSSLMKTVMNAQRNATMRSAAGAAGSPVQQARSQAALIKAQGQIQAAQQRSTLATQRYQAALARLAAMQAKAAAAAKRHQSSLGTLTQKISDAEHNVDALWRASFRLQMLGADFQRWGQNMIGAVMDVTNQYGEFEFMANRAAGTLRLFNTDATGAAVSTYDLQDAVMSAAKEMRLFPAEDVAKAVYFWGSTTGQVVESQEDLENVMSSLTPVMKAAALTQTEYETAIKGTYGIMTQFYPEVIEAANATGEYAEMAEVAEEVTTRLFFATQVTALEYTNLVEAFKMVGPVAAGVGASLEDMVGLMGRLADLGIRGSMAGRSFRQMFMRMAAPPGPARKAIDALFKSLDYDVFEGKSYLEVMFPEGEFAGTDAFFRNMTKAVKDLNTVERINFLTKFSTANLLPTMIALIGQEERRQAGLGGEVDKTNVLLETQRKVFEQSWSLLAGSWKGAVEGFNRSMESLRLVVGRAFAEGLKPFVDEAAKVVDKVKEWVDANQPLVEQLGQWAAALGGVLIAIGTLFITMGSAIGVVAGLRLAFEAFGGVILRWSGYALVIGAFIDAILRNFDEIQARLQEAQQSIQRALDNVAGYFSDGGDAASTFADAFSGLMDTVVEHMSNAIVVIAHFIEEISRLKPIFDLIKTFGIPVIAQFLTLFLGFRMLSAIAHLKLFGLSIAGASTGLVGFSRNLRSTNTIIGPTLTNMQRLQLSFKNFARQNPHLILMAVAGFAFAAYENNWLNFRDMVDGITNSFRDLKKEISGIQSDVRTRDWMQGFFEKQDTSGLISSFQEAKDKIANSMKGEGILPDLVLDLTADVDVLNLRKNLAAAGRFYSAAVLGTGSAERAFADLNTYINEAGYSFQTWVEAFRIAQGTLDLGPTGAESFASAIGEVMKDGVGTVGELEVALRNMGLAGEYYINQLTDAQLEHLGLTSRSAEEAQRLEGVYEGMATGLISALQSIPTSNLTDEQFINVASIIGELNEAAQFVGPEFRDTIDKAIAPYVALAGEDMAMALGEGFTDGDPEAVLMAYFADLGATHVPAGMFSDLAAGLQLAIGEAMALQPGAPVDLDTILQKLFADMNVELVTDFLYPKISAIGDGVAAAIAGVFRPGKFKDQLKDITKDEKGWKNFWKAVTDPIFQSALAGEKGSEAQAIADEWAQSLFTNFETAFPAASGPARDRLATRLTDFFNAKSLPGMSESLQRFGTNLLVTMYDTLDQPMPEWLKTYFINFGGEIPGYIKDGAEGPQVTITPNVDVDVPTPEIPQVDPRTGEVIVGNIQRQLDAQPKFRLPAPAMPTANDELGGDASSTNPYMRFLSSTKVAMLAEPPMPVPPIAAPDTSAVTTAIDEVSSDTTATLTALAGNATTWGSHLVGNLAAAIRRGRDDVASAASYVASAIPDKLKFSKGPDEGPLKGFNDWGVHMMDNYAAAINKGAPGVDRATKRVADIVARGLNPGKGKTSGETGKNGKPLDGKKHEKMLMTSVGGAHLYNTYGGYLDYLDTVHNRINDYRTKIKRSRDDATHDLKIGRHKTEGQTGYEFRHKRQVEVKITVESPDGSVNRMSLAEVRRGAMDTFALADIEHIATVS